jgi:endonuclease/exonuclease/phosphatase family metal-dependent hydrolase
VRLATFNVKNGVGPDGVVDNDRLARACAALRADVLALQEVDRESPRAAGADQAAVVGAVTGVAHAYAPAKRLRQGGLYGNALVAGGAIEDVEVLDLPVEPGREARVALLAAVDLDGTRLSVAATHFQNRRGGTPRRAADAGEQLAQLHAVLEALARRPAPHVVLGDLNMGPEVAEPVLGDAGFVTGETGPTCPARAPRVRIDYVAVAGLTIASMQLVRCPVSDHLAVVAEVCVP